MIGFDLLAATLGRRSSRVAFPGITSLALEHPAGPRWNLDGELSRKFGQGALTRVGCPFPGLGNRWKHSLRDSPEPQGEPYELTVPVLLPCSWLEQVLPGSTGPFASSNFSLWIASSGFRGPVRPRSRTEMPLCRGDD